MQAPTCGVHVLIATYAHPAAAASLGARGAGKLHTPAVLAVQAAHSVLSIAPVLKLNCIISQGGWDRGRKAG